VLGGSLARSAQPQMSARHAKRRDSICCDSVGCSSICAASIDAAPICFAPVANDLTTRGARVLRFLSGAPSLRAVCFCAGTGARAVDFCADSSVRFPASRCERRNDFDWQVSVVDITETGTGIDRALDCVDVSANDRRFNQRGVALSASLSSASLFMTLSLETSCTTASAQSSSRMSSSHLPSSRVRSSHVLVLQSAASRVPASSSIHPVELPI
jgi:hypothetical protein